MLASRGLCGNWVKSGQIGGVACLVLVRVNCSRFMAVRGASWRALKADGFGSVLLIASSQYRFQSPRLFDYSNATSGKISGNDRLAFRKY
jgi:hypothetical protein